MSRIQYEKWSPDAETRIVVRQADGICAELGAQGYDLTLRQLYYQFVSRDLIANTLQSYKRLGSIINRARLAGLLDWSYIVDRTRELKGVNHWDSPDQIVRAVASQYRIDKWANQPTRVEVWVEKEALAGVVKRAAERADVSWFSCRGYPSQSEIWEAGQRLARYIQDGQRVVILHLGDHDPSGIDMTRDIKDRLEKFILTDHLRDNPPVDVGWWDPGEDDLPPLHEIAEAMAYMYDIEGDEVLQVNRIALNRDQITRYSPPPNPAKITDSRARGYILEHGRQSWELDALSPQILDELITSEIELLRDEDDWEPLAAREAGERTTLTNVSDQWSDVATRYGVPE